ncbi:helix-turn-helix transcriptional regulator [Clostridium sp. UBA1056]|uniref:helix-turn-helix domain-containing protein n=1 Tax=unclassified Clostridium TaxID=2614128 RepID=UPI0032179702
MIKFRLAELLEEKNVSRYKLSKETKIADNALKKICNNETSSISLGNLEKICNFLDCTISEFMIIVDGD